ncbi:hypothetical protein [Thiomonas sp. X19]|uniref:hypothetical protein n=1 Tax=Thiomonas sp. X19 TaxID=1050370 RepID=UPI0018EBC769|nr:hypothetical protein [Thiomonas sp. X19]
MRQWQLYANKWFSFTSREVAHFDFARNNLEAAPVQRHLKLVELERLGLVRRAGVDVDRRREVHVDPAALVDRLARPEGIAKEDELHDRIVSPSIDVLTVHDVGLVRVQFEAVRKTIREQTRRGHGGLGGSGAHARSAPLYAGDRVHW